MSDHICDADLDSLRSLDRELINAAIHWQLGKEDDSVSVLELGRRRMRLHHAVRAVIEALNAKKETNNKENAV